MIPEPYHFISAEALDKQIAQTKAFRAMIEDHEAFHLSALAAGAVSPLHDSVNEPDLSATPEKALMHGGTLGLSDLPDEATDEFAQFWQDVSLADLEQLQTRDSEFVYYCKNRAGEVTDAETYETNAKARATVKAQTIDLALALSGHGIPAFKRSHEPSASIVDPIAKQVVQIPPVRRLNIFPLVAAGKRAPLITHLEAFLEIHPWAKMATFTIGRRRRLDRQGEFRSGVQLLHRRLSKLNAHPLLKSHGCRMHFRATEFGTFTRACPWPREPGNENGVIYGHIHAHVFLTFEHKLSPRRARRFLRKLWNIWKWHFDIGHAIGQAREACKYPVKPGDFDIMTDAEKAAFYHETKRLHMVQPMGELRETISARNLMGYRGRKWRETDGDLKLRFRPDWNVNPNRKTPQERYTLAAVKERERKPAYHAFRPAAALFAAARAVTIAAARLHRSSAFLGLLAHARGLAEAGCTMLRLAMATPRHRLLVGRRILRDKDAAAKPRLAVQNRVVARLAPATYFDRVTRPALLVWGFNGDWAAIENLSFVREYMSAVRPKIEAAERALAAEPPNHRVHTSHLTVRREEVLTGLQKAEAWA